MLNKKIICSLLIGVSIMFVGCSSKDLVKTNNDSVVLTIEKDAKLIPIEAVNENSLSEASKDTLKNLSEKNGFSVIEKTPEGMSLFIGLGERKTGGYEISVQDSYVKDNSLYVRYKALKPSKDASTTMAISYPSTVINLKTKDLEKIENVKVIDVDNSKELTRYCTCGDKYE